MQLSINSPMYYRDHYGIEDIIYKYCQDAFIFFKIKNIVIC